MATAPTCPDRGGAGARPEKHDGAGSGAPGTSGARGVPTGRDGAGPGGLVLAGGMAFLAGATDVHGLSVLHDLFVSFMSGNTTLLGKALGQGDLRRAEGIAAVLCFFVGGAAAGAAVAERTGALRTAAVTAVVALLLTGAALRPEWEAGAVVAAMGALNAALDHVGRASVSLTYVTGTLVKFGQGLGRFVSGKGGGFGWLVQAPMWLSLLAGATAAAWAGPVLDRHAVWPLAIIAALLSLGALGAALGARARR